MNEKMSKEIRVEIFSRLGMRALVRMKCVCKEWRKLIEDDHCLPNMQLARARKREKEGEEEALILMSGYDGETCRLKLLLRKMNDNNNGSPKPLEQRFPDNRYGYRVHNSCNGLLSFSWYQGGSERVFVCNPLLGKHHRPFISPPTSTDTRSLSFSVSGLGFDSSTNNHKILHLYMMGTPKVSIMDMEGSSSSWREICDHLPGKYPNRFDPAMVYVSGALHWWYDLGCNLHKLISFDLAQEKFRILPCQFTGTVEFVDLRGYLGVAQGPLHSAPDAPCIDIWKLKEYEKNVWVRPYRIQISQLRRDISAFADSTASDFMISPFANISTYSFTIIGLIGDDEILLKKFGTLAAYNSKTHAARVIHTVDESFGIFGTLHVLTCTGSLISPPSTS